MPSRDIIVIGASAGGIEAITELLRRLPGDLPAALFVVTHMAPEAPSMLPQIWGRYTDLNVVGAQDGAPIRRGTVYVACPDQHLLIESGRIHNTRGPRENRHRPAIDPLFRTAARAYGPRVVAVVLSGMLDDGAVGLQVVKAAGGIAIVQDPKDAEHGGLPRNAIESDTPDHVLPVREIAKLLVDLARRPVAEPAVNAMKAKRRPKNGKTQTDEPQIRERVEEERGAASGYTCPECHGALFEHEHNGISHYRCRVGHAYSLDALIKGSNDVVEGAMWAALRALEENAAIARRAGIRAKALGQPMTALRMAQQADAKEEQARLLRELLLRASASPAEVPAEPEAQSA